MTKELNQSIFTVIGETYSKYGEEHTVGAIGKALMDDDFTYFTNKGSGARATLKSMLKEYEKSNAKTIENTFLEGILSCYLTNLNVPPQEMLEEESFVDNVKNIFAGADFYPMESMRQIVASIYSSYEKEQHINTSGLKVSNIKLHASNMHHLKDSMITGLTLAKEGELYLGNMHACTSIGKKRTNQQDAVLLKKHAENEDFKFLVVSDGMGGGIAGEEVSDLTIREVSNWFDELPVAYYKNPELLSEKLAEHLKKISRMVAGKYHGNAGATFVGALVCEDETVVINVGDSRAYTYDKRTNQLVQRSKDHSYVQELYNAGFIKSRDDMRFHIRANSITQYIGMRENTVDVKFVPAITRIPNKDYNVLMLFSDGVTDFMSDEEILVVTQNTKKRELAKRIIEVAMENVSTPNIDLPDEVYYSERVGGGDNLSAVVLNKPRKKKSSERGERR